VSESLPANDADAQKRRSTRIAQAVPVTVIGVDALGQPFKERTTTVTVNCHGCKYQSRHYVPKDSAVTLEIARLDTSLAPRVVVGRVVWVQRPRTVRELFQIGLELETPGDVWGMAFPPEDWFACPDEAPIADASTTSGASESSAEPSPQDVPPPRALGSERKPEPTAAPPAKPAPAKPPAAGPTASPPPSVPASTTLSTDGKIRLMPSPAQSQEAQLAAARQMAKMVAEVKETLDRSLHKDARAAIAEELAVVRLQLDAQIHDAIERAVKSSMELSSDSAMEKVVQQAADRTAAIVEQARKANEASSAEQIDAKVHRAVREAVTHAAEQAAQQAAQMAAAHNLEQSVEEVVRRVSVEREASAPPPQIPSSTEAATQRLDQWKKDLEEAAENVRGRSVDQSRTDLEATSLRLHEQFEVALALASQKLDEKLSEVSRTAALQAERDHAAQSSSLRTLLDEVVIGAQSRVRSLEQGLIQERERIEEAKTQLQEESRSTLEQTHGRFNRLVAERFEEIGPKADQLVEERARQLEPVLQNSAQRVLERFSGELDQKLAQRLEQVERVGSELGNAEQRASALLARIQEQVQGALEQAAQSQVSVREQVHQASEGALDKLTAELASAVEQAARFQNSIREQAAQASERAAQTEDRVREQVQRASEETLLKVTAELASAEQQAARLQNSIREQAEQASEQAAQTQDAVREQVHRATEEALLKVSAELASAVEQAARFQNSIREQVERATEQAAHAVEIQDSARGQVDKASEEAIHRVTAELASAVEQASRFQNSIREQVERATEQAAHAVEIQDSVRGQIDKASEEAIHRVTAELASAVEQATRSQLNSIREQAEQASEQMARTQDAVREQFHRVSDEVLQQSLARLREETARYPAEIEQSCRAVLLKLGEEVERKNSEAQHEIYETLSKASEWYQRKAQTTMQSTLEKAVEQSTSSLRDRAAEISSLVASELDHFRRTYVEHSQGEIEESAKQAVDRERAKLGEAAEIANATFTDGVRRLTQESLRRFEDASRQALEKARSDMESNREGSLADFQKNLDERMTQGVDQARTFLQSELVPMLESWGATREVEKQEWVQRWTKSADESLEQYKLRLEKASNAWLLASATTLGQNSQTVLDTLSKAAEKRLRETCAEILSGMGDTLKERLMEISSAFSRDEDDLPQNTK
jgi:hypothetical protein